MQGAPYMGQPIVLDLGDAAWQRRVDAVEQWLGNVLAVQQAFRKLAEDTADKIAEPHIRDYLQDLARSARDQERKAEELFEIIGHEPPSKRGAIAGAVTAKAREAVADVQGVLGGAAGGWRDLHQLLLAGVNAMGAFAVVEQLGLALGLAEIVQVAFPVVQELSTAQLLLQELMLETAPPATLSGERP